MKMKDWRTHLVIINEREKLDKDLKTIMKVSTHLQTETAFNLTFYDHHLTLHNLLTFFCTRQIKIKSR